MTPERSKVPLDGPQVERAGLTHWRLIGGGPGAQSTLRARFATGDFASGLRFVDRIGELAEAADHHPDVELRYRSLGLALLSHDVGAITIRDVNLARQISAVADDLGLVAEPHRLARLSIALDTADAAAVRPFWVAMLDAEPNPADDSELNHPHGDVASLWFQHSPSAGEHGAMRFHLDLYVPHDVAEQRLAAALAAGGRLVTDEFAPSWWVVNDPDGNAVCLSTWEDPPQPA